jgi:hypothetical protein
MSLFKSRDKSPPPATTQPARKGTLFGRRSHSPTPTDESYHTTHTGSGGGFFGKRRSSSSDSETRHRGSSMNSGSGSSARTGGFGSMFGSNHGGDHSILAARQAVTDAEESERQADRALSAARTSVREARQHIKALEQEAKAECVSCYVLSCTDTDDLNSSAARAKAKQAEAKIVSKTARGLGRHS